MNFEKATLETGVDSHFTFEDPRVSPFDEASPATFGSDEFWQEFCIVCESAGAAKNKLMLGDEVSVALRHRVRNAYEAAQIVRADRPVELMSHALVSASPKPRDLGLRVDFIDGTVMIDRVMATIAHLVAPSTFAAKWMFLYPRPEEVAGAIARGELDAPSEVRHALKAHHSLAFIAGDQRKFTVFDEGSPMHPSYPAMHSAVAGALYITICTLCDLNDYQELIVWQTARNMAYFRTYAGVHYPMDNRAGLLMGQRVAMIHLPMVANQLGLDADEVVSVAEEKRIDWNF